MKVVIFGKGKVGVATDSNLKTNADFHDPAKGLVIEDFSQYDVAFICVSSLEKGPTDHDAIQMCLDTLNKASFKGTVAIRCTVSPVFLRSWGMLYPQLKMIHFPEFMRQRDDDYLDEPWIIVLGGNQKLTIPFAIWLADRGHGTEEQWHFCTMEESALIKLHQNAGLALKVVFANIMYETCQLYGADYEKVRKGVGADVRVGPGHLAVPGDDGFGFAGHCLPKDLKCLNGVGYNRNFWSTILKINNELRSKNGKDSVQ